MKILFITSTRIGDGILSTGLLAYLIAKHPKTQVTIACGSLAAPLFKNVPGLERIIELKRKKFSYHWIDLWARTFGTFWDYVVDIRGSALAYLIPNKNRAVWRSQKSSLHKVQQLGSLLGLEKAPPSPTVWLGAKEIQAAEKRLPAGSRYIGVGPVANWTGKEWPQDYFRDLLVSLTDSTGALAHATPVIFSAPHERQRIQPLVRSLKPLSAIDLTGQLGLLEAVACLKRCDLYVGNDSGLMHLSAACGTPTVGLFGPSPVDIYAPWGSHTRAVQTDIPYEELVQQSHSQESLLRSLPVSKVQDSIVDLLAQRKEKG